MFAEICIFHTKNIKDCLKNFHNIASTKKTTALTINCVKNNAEGKKGSCITIFQLIKSWSTLICHINIQTWPQSVPTSMQNVHEWRSAGVKFQKLENSIYGRRKSLKRQHRRHFPHNSSDVDGEFHLHKLVEICSWQTVQHTTYGRQNFPLMLRGANTKWSKKGGSGKERENKMWKILSTGKNPTREIHIFLPPKALMR